MRDFRSALRAVPNIELEQPVAVKNSEQPPQAGCATVQRRQQPGGPWERNMPEEEWLRCRSLLSPQICVHLPFITMAALSFIGKPISLISHSDVRYRGILAGIDPVASTIQLSNVYSMGTESRRPPDQYIPPVQEPYTYIIFRASEVKDLAVDETAPQRRSVHDDPAVLGASAPQAAPSAYPPPAFNSPSYQQQVPAAVPQQQGQVPPRQQGFQNRQQPGQPSGSQQTSQSPAPQANGSTAAPSRTARNSSVNSATASLETVERALGDLRVSNANANNGANQHQRGGRRGGRGQGQEAKAGGLPVPDTEFDFESSNARFDKAALASSARGVAKTEGSETPDGEAKDSEATAEEDAPLCRIQPEEVIL
ncbi:hypothetical protein ONZ51_g3902 [Trametes cubensis]|uniref:Uncharacterized protein n=1 Tax=Trametes cubensis TaxID=1111947 RepID=A0AAD7TXD0_9APHY|nr:hypothetical protein ONZ51_g3902 [Trametes cubensis]